MSKFSQLSEGLTKARAYRAERHKTVARLVGAMLEQIGGLWGLNDEDRRAVLLVRPFGDPNLGDSMTVNKALTDDEEGFRFRLEVRVPDDRIDDVARIPFDVLIQPTDATAFKCFINGGRDFISLDSRTSMGFDDVSNRIFGTVYNALDPNHTPWRPYTSATRHQA